MSVFVQSMHAVVFALASAAFAHFGVVLKDAPCHKTEQAVRRIAVVAVAPPQPSHATPCPLAKHVVQA
jgi:hypothetical protein